MSSDPPGPGEVGPWDVFSHALDAMFLADDEGRYVDVNPAACELTGYRRDQLLGLSVADLASPAQRDQVPHMWREFLTIGHMEGEFDLVGIDGSVLVTEFKAVADVAPGLHLSVIRNITDRIEAQRAAAEREERIDLILDQLPAALWTVDRDLRFTLVRGGSATGGRRQLVADDENHPRGRGQSLRQPNPADAPTTVEDVVVDDGGSSVLDAHRRALDGEASSYEVSVDRTVWFCHVEQLCNRNGSVEGVIGVGLDLTEVARRRESMRDTVRTVHELDLERRLALAVARAREDERRRLARDLHDDLGHTLALVTMSIRVLQRTATPELVEQLDELHQLAQRAADAARRLVGQLRPEHDEDSMLEARLNRMASEIEANDEVSVDVSIVGNSAAVPVIVAAATCGIAGEAAINAAKHAEAQVISIVVVIGDDRLTLVVEDDGKGFDHDVSTSAAGHGLAVMTERAHEVGGELAIATARTKGTMIRAEIPLEGP